MNNYWHIELYSGEIIKVKPDANNVSMIQNKIAKQAGAITTPTRSIVIKDIKDFRLSDEPVIDQKLLEDVSQAFNEPVYTPEGAVAAKWVKKSIPKRRWHSFFEYIPAYRLLREDDMFAVVAFRVPTHLIDHQRVQELSPDELRMVVNTN